MSAPTPIASDFLSLLAQQGIAPLKGGLAAGAPVETQATTVFAFEFADGVLMVGDRRATAGNVIVTDVVEKVMELDSTSLLAIAGVPATAFEMARVEDVVARMRMDREAYPSFSYTHIRLATVHDLVACTSVAWHSAQRGNSRPRHVGNGE